MDEPIRRKSGRPRKKEGEFKITTTVRITTKAHNRLKALSYDMNKSYTDVLDEILGIREEELRIEREKGMSTVEKLLQSVDQR